MMRFRPTSRRSTVVLTTTTLALTTTLVAGSAAADNGEAAHSCVSVSGLAEQTVKYDFVGPGTAPMQQVGDTALYTDTIFGTDGSVVGKALGYVTVVAIRPSDGHLITDYQETVQLPQGTLRDTGRHLDRTAMIAGQWLHFTATGTSGQFAGKHGFRQWRLMPPLSNPPVPSEKAQVVIKLCG